MNPGLRYRLSRGPPRLERRHCDRLPGIMHASAFALDDRGRLWVAASGATTHLATPSCPPCRHALAVEGERTIRRSGSSGATARSTGLARRGGGRRPARSRPASRAATTLVLTQRPAADGGLGHRSAVRTCARRPAIRCTNQRDDLGSKTPGDWLAVCDAADASLTYGQGGPACTGVPAPVAVLDPHAAAGGVAILGGTALVAEWQLGKVVAVRPPWGKGHRDRSKTRCSCWRSSPVLVGDWTSGVRLLTLLLACGDLLQPCSTFATCAASFFAGADGRSSPSSALVSASRS